uniref:Procollagen C-endopeptidase enhancer b n=1 Tax=Hucho hucho TaxID=62062 RepID=A0A4W5LX07_9TELE
FWQYNSSLSPSLSLSHALSNSLRPIFHCGGHLVTDSGFVGSEGFPSHYKPNRKCTWYIAVPEGHVVMLSFRMFDLEADPTCRYDYLDVYNGHSHTVQKLGRFCGTFRPGALISTSNTMMLEMVSDSSTGGRGFVAHYQGGKPHMDGENQFCGGRLTKAQGSVKTPNWPNSDYPAGISCSWHISVKPSNVITVKFEKLDIEADSYCRYDYVAFFNGGERDDSRRIGKYCGDRVPRSENLLVQFVSDLSVTSNGFMAHYSSVPRGSRTPSAGGDTIQRPRVASTTQKPIFKLAKPARTTPKPKSAIRAKPSLKPACKRTGTLQSNFCATDFVITGKVTSLVPGPRGSVTVDVSLIKAYRSGRLAITQSGPAMSVKLASTCKKCPGLRKGANYVLMGKVDTEGHGLLNPSSFALLYKAVHTKALATLALQPC